MLEELSKIVYPHDMLRKRAIQALIYRTTGRILVDPNRFSIVERDESRAAHSPHLEINCSPRKNFEQAKQDAGLGYQNPAIVCGAALPSSPISEMTLQSHFGALFAALAIASRGRGTLSVLDFGGALGAHYHLAEAAFGGMIKMKWIVVESPLYVRHARERGFENPPILDSIDTAADLGEFDLVLFSGVLQYLDNWREPLAHPAVRRADYILISRMPIGETEIPYLQTITRPDKTIRYPGRVMAMSDIADALATTHQRNLTWETDHHLGEMGVYPAPSMLWRRANQTMPSSE